MFEIKAGHEGSAVDLQVKGGGVESVSGTAGSTFTATIYEALRAKEKERKDANSRLVTFLEMLDALERQIAALDERIAEYEGELEQLETQLAALEELRDLIESGEYDPTNPDHIALLKRSNIPSDEWGVLTVDRIDDYIDPTKGRIEELEKKIEIAKDQRGKLKAERDAKSGRAGWIHL